MAVVSLSDYNQKQIDDLLQEQRNMTEQFEKRKEGLRALGPTACLLQNSTHWRHSVQCWGVGVSRSPDFGPESESESSF